MLVAFRATGRESARPAPDPGRFCWETLVTPEPAAAAFYGKVVGFPRIGVVAVIAEPGRRGAGAAPAALTRA